MKTDIQLQEHIMDQLQWEPTLDSTEIGVTVKDGIVTLSGSVDRYTKKLVAENAAKKVAGVTAVAEEIDVILPGHFNRNDTEIARSIMAAIKWHTAVKEDRVKIKVEDGWVTLDGGVEWQFQRDAVEIAIEDIVGIKGINNLITVHPQFKATRGGHSKSVLLHIYGRPIIHNIRKLKKLIAK